MTDTKTDPLEKENLATKSSAINVKNRLKNELTSWMKSRNITLDPTVTRLPKETKRNLKQKTDNE